MSNFSSSAMMEGLDGGGGMGVFGVGGMDGSTVAYCDSAIRCVSASCRVLALAWGLRVALGGYLFGGSMFCLFGCSVLTGDDDDGGGGRLALDRGLQHRRALHHPPPRSGAIHPAVDDQWTKTKKKTPKP